MSVNKGLTRIDDAVIPDELVRFSQLGGGGEVITFLGFANENSTSSVSEFNAVFGVRRTTDETDVQLTFDDAFTLTRWRCQIGQNTKGSATNVNFRDDATNAATLAVPAVTTGNFDSGVISVAVAALSLINLEVAGTVSGNFRVESAVGRITIP